MVRLLRFAFPAALGTTILFSLTAVPVQAATLNVCKQGCSYLTIQSAVDASRSGDIIKIGKGTYFENVSILDKTLTLTGAGKDFTTLDGGFKDSVIKFNVSVASSSLPKVSIVGLSVTHGKADYGGGISIFYGKLYLQDVIVTSNRATGGGGGIAISGSPSEYSEIVRSVVTHNIADGGTTNAGTRIGAGGGVYLLIESLLKIRDSSITRNSAAADGGGVYVDYKSTNEISGTTLSDNVAGANGGAIAAGVANDPEKGESASVLLTQSTVTNNSAGNDGGGVVVNRGGVSITESVIARNKSAHDGGGAATSATVNATLALTNSFVIQNSAKNLGGGISGPGVILNNTLVSANSPTD